MDIKIKFILLLLISSHLTVSWGQEAVWADIDRLAQSYIEKTKNSGLVIAVVQGDAIQFQGYGQFDRRDSRRPDEHTLFETGAVTQVFTTTLAILESRQGAFHIEESIRPFIPENIDVPDFQPMRCMEITIPKSVGPPQRLTTCTPDPAAERVCIAFCDLASHTSGLPNAPAESFNWLPLMAIRDTGEPCPDFTRDQLYAGLGTYELKNIPGLEFRYSNLGIALLGNLVADIAGSSYADLLQRHLTGPLNLTDTRLVLSPEQESRLIPGHDVKGKTVPAWPLSVMAPSCGLKSTARDLAAFVQANLRSRNEQLDRAFEMVQQPYVDVRFPGWNRSTQAGYGWLISLLSEESNLPVTWISGGTTGQRSFVGFIKDTRNGVVVLANNAEPVTELGFEVLARLHD